MTVFAVPVLVAAAPMQNESATGDGAAASKPESFDAVPADAGQPFGGMAISPTRLVLDGARGGQVTVYNSSSATVSYRVEALDIAIDEQGQYTPVDAATVPAWSALPHIRYAPRQVTLAPGQRQTIKILARPPATLPAGELRSHLRFSSIPLVAPVDDSAAPKPEEESRTVSVTVGMDFRVTIPVLLRVGQPGGGATIDAVKMTGTEAQVTLARTGARSDYGSLRLIDAQGATVGQLRGVSVPAPLVRRIFPVTLTGAGAGAGTGGGRPVKALYVEELPGMRDGAIIAERAIE